MRDTEKQDSGEVDSTEPWSSPIAEEAFRDRRRRRAYTLSGKCHLKLRILYLAPTKPRP